MQQETTTVSSPGAVTILHLHANSPSGTQAHLAACFDYISSDGSVIGQWDLACVSETRGGSYAQFFGFTLTQDSEVTLTLESNDADTYLYLRRGDIASGEATHENDDHEGSTSVSRIQATLTAGSYTIETTTYGEGETGSFTLTTTVDNLLSVNVSRAAGSENAAVRPGSPVSLTATFSRPVSGFTVDDITIGNGAAGSFAGSGAVYTFDVTPNDIGEVTLEIAAGAAEDADGERNTPVLRFSLGITYDDDGDGGISTTEVIAAIGDYFDGDITTAQVIEIIQLYFAEPGGTTGPGSDCSRTLPSDGSTSGQWASGCDSEAREGSYARFYSFTLTQDSRVTLTLESNEADTYLYLRQGDVTSGTVLYENNNHQGSTSRSQIQATLPAGTYTIEATTNSARETGSFSLTISRQPVGQTHAGDKAVLIAFFDATGGQDWARNAGWKSEAPLGQWYGVTVDAKGRVVRLSLSTNGLVGEIPVELGSFANLTWLEIGGNQLTGEIPEELGSFANLTWLEIGGNQLTGEIPEELGSFANLTSLEIGGNQLTGEIPGELGSLANLTSLSLYNNQLTGEIPEELGSLANLTSLYLAGNQLTGCIPEGLREVSGNDIARLGLPDCGSDCSQILSSDGSTRGQWASGCDSETREGSYARFYSFTLTQDSRVTLTLESNEADTYLYLRQGDATSGTVLYENDNYQGSTSRSHCLT